MIAVPLQDPVPARSTQRTRWITARRALVGSVALLLLLAAGWFIGLPLLLRTVINQSLREAGVRETVQFDIAKATPWGSRLTHVVAGEAVTIDRIDLNYSLRDLWYGRLDAIRLMGAGVKLRVNDGRVDVEPILSLVSFSRTAKSDPASPAVEPADPPAATQPALRDAARAIPLELFTFSSSTLTFVTPARVVEIPVTGSIAQDSANQLRVRLDAGVDQAVLLSAAIDLSAMRSTFEGGARTGQALSVVRSIWPAADVTVGGRMLLSGFVDWSGELSGQARLEISEVGGSSQPGIGKLHFPSGVFKVEVSGGSQQRSVRLSTKDASFASSEGFSVTGVNGNVILDRLAPLHTPPRQLLTAEALTIGDMKLTDGHMEFEVSEDRSIFVNETRWTWLGGQAWANDVRVSPGRPFRASLHIRDVELTQVLDAYASEKLEGEGKLGGEVPIIVQDGQVTIGNGQLASVQGGRLRMKDREMIDAVAAQAGASQQVKRSITEALQDFVYDRMAVRFLNDPEGLLTRVQFGGHGRTGEKQEMSFDLRVRGVQELLNLALGVHSAVSTAEDRMKRNGAAGGTERQ